MTAAERKFEKARKQTIKRWERLLANHLGYDRGVWLACGFCQDCAPEYRCDDCSLWNSSDDSCEELIACYAEDFFDEDEDNIISYILLTITVLITLHHMAPDAVLDKPLIEWVEE